jgi:hypothetical protein
MGYIVHIMKYKEYNLCFCSVKIFLLLCCHARQLYTFVFAISEHQNQGGMQNCEDCIGDIFLPSHFHTFVT